MSLSNVRACSKPINGWSGYFGTIPECRSLLRGRSDIQWDVDGDSNPRGGRAILRCPHCAAPLSKEMETSNWTVRPLIRDSFSMIGSAFGGTTSAFYGFNHVMPIVRRWVKGPMWLHFLIGAPPVIVFSSACAGFAGGAVSALAQVGYSSYLAAVLSSTLPSASSQDYRVHKSRTSCTL